MKQISISSRITSRETESFKKYLKDVAMIELMTPQEEYACAEKASKGDQAAIDEMVRRNLRFVISVAKQYANDNNKIEDLVNEGNIGLILAVKHFKPAMGFKFISYAVWWIRKIIMEHISKHGRSVRLPANKINALSKLDKKVALLEQKLGRTADISEIFDELGGDINKEEVSLLETLSNLSIDSLDRDMSKDGSVDDSGFTLGDLITDSTAPETDHLIVSENIKTEIGEIMLTLKPRDRRVIIALFGLDGNTPMTLKEVSEEVGVTREMIRQIKEKNLKVLKEKLKNSTIRTCI